MEHRWGFRQSTDLTVRLVTSPAAVATGRITNVSCSGAFLETAAGLRVLSLIYLEPVTAHRFPSRTQQIAASVVRRTREGVGLEWAFSTEQNLSVSALLNILSGHVRFGRGRPPVPLRAGPADAERRPAVP